MSLVVPLRVIALLNEHELAALLWDALTAQYTDQELAALKAGREPLTKQQVRQLVRERLLSAGQNSVCCGPTSDVPCSAKAQEACLAAVRNAFGGSR